MVKSSGFSALRENSLDHAKRPTEFLLKVVDNVEANIKDKSKLRTLAGENWLTEFTYTGSECDVDEAPPIGQYSYRLNTCFAYTDADGNTEFEGTPYGSVMYNCDGKILLNLNFHFRRFSNHLLHPFSTGTASLYEFTDSECQTPTVDSPTAEAGINTCFGGDASGGEPVYGYFQVSGEQSFYITCTADFPENLIEGNVFTTK